MVTTATLLRTDKDIERIYHRHVEMLYRVAYSFMKNGADAEDMVQETFIRLLRSPWRRREDIDTMSEPPTVEDTIPDETLDAVMALPEDYKLPVYLYYYEGYQTAEIAEMLGVAPATVRSRLSRARQKLKLTLGGVYDHDA